VKKPGAVDSRISVDTRKGIVRAVQSLTKNYVAGRTHGEGTSYQGFSVRGESFTRQRVFVADVSGREWQFEMPDTFPVREGNRIEGQFVSVGGSAYHLAEIHNLESDERWSTGDINRVLPRYRPIVMVALILFTLGVGTRVFADKIVEAAAPTTIEAKALEGKAHIILPGCRPKENCATVEACARCKEANQDIRKRVVAYLSIPVDDAARVAILVSIGFLLVGSGWCFVRRRILRTRIEAVIDQ
jgi:hypothetical protein